MNRSGVLSRSGSRQMEVVDSYDGTGYDGPGYDGTGYDGTGYDGPPVPTGVRPLVTPQGRTVTNRNRDIIEKNMLLNRHSNYERHGAEIMEPFKITQDNPSFMSDADRYHTDVAGEAKMHRQQERHKMELADYHLRAERQDRENRRWHALEQKKRDEEARLHDLRFTGAKTRKNISGSAFNPITGQIDNTNSGTALRKRDDITRQRAFERTKWMTKANNSPFNPITGADYSEQPRPIPTAY